VVWLPRFLHSGSEPPRAGRARLTLPDDDRVIYAIGDVHGCFDEFLVMEEMIAADAASLGDRPRMILLLGDMIDRGPRSEAVIEHLLRPPPAGFERMALCGNHEAAMLAFLADAEAGWIWMEYGGVETLRSYGIAVPPVVRRGDLRRLATIARATVPEAHLAFLRGLPISAQWDGYLFVHAGIRPGIAFAHQDDDDLLFIRDEFLESTADHGWTVVHGHTPAIEAGRFHGRIGIDTGAYATGRLSAVRIDRAGVAFMTATARNARRSY